MYDLTVGSTYQDKNTGTDKTRWTKIGVMREKDNGQGFTIFLDALPLTNMVQAFEKKPKDENQSQPAGGQY